LVVHCICRQDSCLCGSATALCPSHIVPFQLRLATIFPACNVVTRRDRVNCLSFAQFPPCTYTDGRTCRHRQTERRRDRATGCRRCFDAQLTGCGQCRLNDGVIQQHSLTSSSATLTSSASTQFGSACFVVKSIRLLQHHSHMREQSPTSCPLMYHSHNIP